MKFEHWIARCSEFDAKFFCFKLKIVIGKWEIQFSVLYGEREREREFCWKLFFLFHHPKWENIHTHTNSNHNNCITPLLSIMIIIHTHTHTIFMILIMNKKSRIQNCELLPTFNLFLPFSSPKKKFMEWQTNRK